jgi:hypothetical protein
VTAAVDILSDEYIAEANDELAEKPCPVCKAQGTAFVVREFVQSNSFSLSGSQMKLSGRFELILHCRMCQVTARLSQ